MPEFHNAPVETIMEGDIRDLAKKIYGRVASRNTTYNEADVTQLIDRIKTAIDGWRDNDITPAGDNLL